MTRSDAHRYAEAWIEAWNRLDIDAVLATFHEDVAFTSPRAFATVGVNTVRGKKALRAYWAEALARVRSLRFTLVRTVWDPETLELAIVYVSEVNGSAKRVSENLRFNRDDEVDVAEVFHGVEGSVR
jgi:steroid delta-isomerase